MSMFYSNLNVWEKQLNSLFSSLSKMSPGHYLNNLFITTATKKK